MNCNIKYHNGYWYVFFKTIKNNLSMFTTNYQKAFFWKKYSKEINAKFILDYIHNV